MYTGTGQAEFLPHGKYPGNLPVLHQLPFAADLSGICQRQTARISVPEFEKVPSAEYPFPGNPDALLCGEGIQPCAVPENPKSKQVQASKPKGAFKRFKANKELDTGRVLNAMCRALKVERSEIGAIRLKDNHVIVELMPLAVSRLEQGIAGLSKFGLYPDEDKRKR